MKICLVEPFHGGSHAAWAEDFARHSRHEVVLLTLSGRRWKWRMHGGAVTLARQFIDSGLEPDLLLVSDMLDLTTFLALTRAKTATLPAALYCHENQLTYPWPDRGDNQQQQHAHYAFINYTSALAADAVLFNSGFHRDAFISQLPGFLSGFPDHNELQSVAAIKEKSRILPLGLDLRRFDAHRPAQPGTPAKPPLILWNHRWEYDKNPEGFFHAPYQLRDKAVPFGASVVQAIYCHCTPLLPNRLAYPEHLPASTHARYLYSDQADLVERLREMLAQPRAVDASLPAHVARYDWREQIEIYDDLLTGLVMGRPVNSD